MVYRDTLRGPVDAEQLRLLSRRPALCLSKQRTHTAHTHTGPHKAATLRLLLPNTERSAANQSKPVDLKVTATVAEEENKTVVAVVAVKVSHLPISLMETDQGLIG